MLGAGPPEPCPAGKVRDWAGICFNKSEAKACLTCEPGSAAPAEKPASTAGEKPEASAQVEANKEVEGTKVKQGLGHTEFGNWLAHQLASHVKAKKVEKPTAAEVDKPNSTAAESLRH